MSKPMALYRALAAAIFFAISLESQAGVIEKSPDLGKLWGPLSSEGTYIYANSFVADVTGSVLELGFWATADDIPGNSQVIFQVYGAGSSPDSSNVIAQTAVLNVVQTDTLQYISAAPLFSGILDAGSQYWFAANMIGLTGADFSVGGHTQNSGGIVDNGTFWFSNDAAGVVFDGEDMTPEMAIRVTIGDAPATDVPAPATLVLFGIALAGLGWSKRRRA